MGTPDYAVPSLRALHQAGHTVAAVVTQPPRPRGRGRSVQPSPVEKAARELGIDVLTPEKPNRRESVEAIAALRPEIILVIAYGAILREKLLALPPRGCVNAHGSLLPRHRGAAPVAAAIRAGDPVSGVTLTRMVRKLDAGPMLLKREIVLDSRETAGLLHDKLAALSADLLVEYLRRIAAGEQVEGEAQDDAQSTYAPLLCKEEGRIDWSLLALEIDRHVRAMHPRPGAFTTLPDGRLLKVHAAEAAGEGGGGPPGRVRVATPREGLVVSTGSGALRLVTIQAPGKRPMDAAAFLRGQPLADGSVLGGQAP